jgi:hypothetical protein
MSAYMGRRGKVYTASSSAVLTYVDSWSMNASIGTADITAYGDSARAYAQTLRDASYTITATLDRSDTKMADLCDQFEDGTLAAIAIRLYTGSTGVGLSTAPYDEFWAGQGLFTGMTVNSAVGDKTGLTFNGVFTGPVKYCTTGGTSA